jgi:nicotinate phosphoribosyltransferase
VPRRRKRLDPSAFPFSVEQFRRDAFGHQAGIWARAVLLADGRSPQVTIQITAEHDGVLSGTDEVIGFLKTVVDDWSGIAVNSLYDGDRVEAGEAVMTIAGAYERFAHLAPLCLGVLSRRTRVATNARLLAEAARPKPVVTVPARNDHFLMHPGDAQAAQIGGVHPLSGAVQPPGRNQPRLQLVPHALVAAYGGDTVAAVRACIAHTQTGEMLVVPVDYENDSVATALAVARSQEAHVWGVQVATSEHLVDRSIIAQMGTFEPAGVNPQLVWNVRNALDAEGFGDIKILVSGAFTAARIRDYEEDGVPVDAYGIGASLLDGRYGFLADVVTLDGEPQARVGIAEHPNARMEKVK